MTSRSAPLPLVRRPTALVDGYAAAVLGRYLREAARSGAFDRLDEAGLGQVLAAVAAIGEAGDAWCAHMDRVSSANGTPEPVPAELVPPSEEMTVEEVAEVLNVSDRQVRKVAPTLGGRKVAGRWVFDPVAVAAEVERRGEVA